MMPGSTAWQTPKLHFPFMNWPWTNLLDETKPFPKSFDAIWMNQFLDCFSENEIVSILQRAAQAMNADSTLYILELFWDRQPNEAAAFCLQQTSLYFACIANGNSQIIFTRPACSGSFSAPGCEGWVAQPTKTAAISIRTVKSGFNIATLRPAKVLSSGFLRPILKQQMPEAP